MEKVSTSRKSYLLVTLIFFGILAFFVLFIVVKTAQSITQPDLQCRKIHATTTQPPTTLVSATDYFDLGNYDYDAGNCSKAISDYTKAIELNPTSVQIYNNRAYTYMRMQQYANALP